MTARRPNYLGIVAGAIVFWIFGVLWYGILWGAAWLSAVGKPKADLALYGFWPFVISFAGGLLAAYCFDNMLWHYERADPVKGAQVGLLTGVCIAATTLVIAYSYQARPVGLMLIDCGYFVIGFIITGAVVGFVRGRAKARA